jgi:hypothetical protein
MAENQKRLIHVRSKDRMVSAFLPVERMPDGTWKVSEKAKRGFESLERLASREGSQNQGQEDQ